VQLFYSLSFQAPHSQAPFWHNAIKQSMPHVIDWRLARRPPTQKSRLAAGSLLNVLNGFGLANCQLLTASIDTSPVDPAPD
jgi:hypothetical protein